MDAVYKLQVSFALARFPYSRANPLFGQLEVTMESIAASIWKAPKLKIKQAVREGR